MKTLRQPATRCPAGSRNSRSRSSTPPNGPHSPAGAPPVPPKKDSAPKAKDKDKPKDEAEEAKPPFELAGKDDYQLAQAVNLLKGLQILQNNGK